MVWKVLPENTLIQLTDWKVQLMLDEEPVVHRYFLTGDAHRKPPFGWTESCPLVRNHFVDLMQRDLLCIHVEQLQDNVDVDSVPVYMRPMLGQNRVFGWELPIFGPLAKAADFAYQLIAPLTMNDIDETLLSLVTKFRHWVLQADGLMATVGNPPAFAGAPALATGLRDYAVATIQGRQGGDQGRNATFMRDLMQYSQNVLALRTSAHPFMAVPIQRIMDRFPICTHIIAFGDAHINTNYYHDPLYNHLFLPPRTTGVVDPSRG